MREHMGLFRGKRIDTGEWVEGYLAGYGMICPNEPEDTYNATGEYCGQIPYVGFVEVDPDSIGECTGLRNKNGKLIFEGDILLYKDCGKIRKYIVGYYAPFAMFMLNDEERHCGSNGMYTQLITCEIIGNVTDNPELLKGGEGDG